MCTTICATPRSCCTIMAEGVGFEPTGDIMPSAVFKTAALNRSATPPWSQCGDLNPKPADYKSAALPIEPHRRGWPGATPGLNLFGAVLPLPDTRLHTLKPTQRSCFSQDRHGRGRGYFHIAGILPVVQRLRKKYCPPYGGQYFRIIFHHGLLSLGSLAAFRRASLASTASPGNPS